MDGEIVHDFEHGLLSCWVNAKIKQDLVSCSWCTASVVQVSQCRSGGDVFRVRGVAVVCSTRCRVHLENSSKQLDVMIPTTLFFRTPLYVPLFEKYDSSPLTGGREKGWEVWEDRDFQCFFFFGRGGSVKRNFE